MWVFLVVLFSNIIGTCQVRNTSHCASCCLSVPLKCFGLGWSFRSLIGDKLFLWCFGNFFSSSSSRCFLKITKSLRKFSKITKASVSDLHVTVWGQFQRPFREDTVPIGSRGLRGKPFAILRKFTENHLCSASFPIFSSLLQCSACCYLQGGSMQIYKVLWKGAKQGRKVPLAFC